MAKIDDDEAESELMMSAWGLWAYMFTYLFPLLLLMVINVEDKRIEERREREG